MFVGIDIGASSTDVVLMDSYKNIIAHEVLATSASHKQSAEKALQSICSQSGCSMSEIKKFVGTGYGRKNISNLYKNVTEITCHAKGARHFFPRARTILDIGGQDSKVIKLDGNGHIMEFFMNEKCAAGTGRFLEAMARILDIPIETMGDLSEKSTHTVKLSSVCTVFAESEVVSKIAEENAIEDIVNGIHDSVSCRAVALLEKSFIEPDVVMTGGVAKNRGIVRKLESAIGHKIVIPPEPQIVGAVGAAIIAYEEYQREGPSHES